MKMGKAIRNALKHADKLGAGAKKRRHLSPDNKFKTVMAEFKRGTLHSGSGTIITNPKQAVAIAYSESRRSKKK